MNEYNELNNKIASVEILYEDDYIIVLNKPYGMVVNRSKTSPNNTIQDFIEGKYDFIKDFDVSLLQNIISNDPLDVDNTDMLSDIDIDEFTTRSGVLHRLDKDTSGVLLVAKDPITFKKIKHQFKSRTVQKEYTAVVMGEVGDEKIEIDAPIKRSPASPLKFAVVEDGKPALTLIEKIKVIKKEEAKFTVLRVFPKTGRTHQIRVHLSAINHPIAGDPIYLSKYNYEMTFKIFNRLMLHSSALSFEHPHLNEVVRYESPLSEDFSKSIA